VRPVNARLRLRQKVVLSLVFCAKWRA